MAETITYRAYHPRSLYNVDVSSTVGKDYIPLFEDIVRMVCIQFTIQLMLYFSGSDSGLFTMELLCITAYVILGVMLYWLVFKHLICFR